MGQDAYALLVYACQLTKEDMNLIRERLCATGDCEAGDDADTILYNLLKKFNKENDCRLDYHNYWQGSVWFISVEKPSLFCGDRNFSVKDGLGGGEATFTMQVTEQDLAAIEALKKQVPETDKPWTWTMVTSYD